MENSAGPHAWTKSTRSGSGDCVEWQIDEQQVKVRDSKDPDGPQLIFTPSEWSAFVAGVKLGEADQHRFDLRQLDRRLPVKWLYVISRAGVAHLAVRQSGLRRKQLPR